MRLASRISEVTDEVIARFVARAQRAVGPGVSVLENSTEELLDNPKTMLFARALGGRRVPNRAIARLEENYLYSTRRFPSAVNNTIGAGALAVNTYPFFGVAAGGLGDSLGFPTGFVLSTQETNMELGGQIPQGQSFVFNQIGVSFNADVSIADASAMLDAANLQFQKSGGQFTLNHGPLKFWPGGTGNGGGAAAAATTVAATTINIQTSANGSPDIRAVRNLRIARVLRANDVFAYNLVVPRTTKATDGTAWALSNFVLVTVWLFGGYKSAIAS